MKKHAFPIAALSAYVSMNATSLSATIFWGAVACIALWRALE